ncbi:hypothetical protein [Paludisphaera sp.]|uniref:hypothetical protein n=1 Tax=Paludisphaera sp. TaxID=2017432 RepID=UPI00301D107B
MRQHMSKFAATGVGLVALALAAGIPPVALAQDGSDAALDALIKEIGEADGPEAGAEKPKKAEDRPTPEEPRKAEEPKKPAPKPDELSGKDKELDDLLQSLGETEDEPETKKERQPPGQPGDEGEDQPPKGEPADARDQGPGLDRDDKAIDEELEELAGRRRKKKDQDDGDGQGSGPMGEIVKEMREIEKRLGEPDTGDETRGRQQQLVKRLETLIERIRQEQQQQNRRMQQVTRQQGGQPGEQEGQQAGNNPDGAPNQRPQRPTDRRALAGGKDEWGHLPPELRQEMENVAKEESLPMSEDLIRRYYLSVSRGKLNRGE